jgi:uncharacterized protein (TIGR02118 family)
MLKFVAMWNIAPGVTTGDFEDWYNRIHIPDAKKIPGLIAYTTNKVNPHKSAASQYYRMAELCFDSLDSAEKAMESPQWQHAFNDAKAWICDHVRLWLDSESISLK